MHQHIMDVLLDGFTAHDVQEGESVELIARGIVTSESPMFFVFAEQIAGLIFPQIGLSSDNVDRYLMVIHEDTSADIYLQDLQTQIQVRLRKSVNAGDKVHRDDVSSIDNVQFPDVKFVKGDRIVYFERKGWRFGIAFDLTRTTDPATFGILCAQLQSKLILDDILQITLTEFRKAQDAGFDAFIITEGKTDWRHLERALKEIGSKRSLRFDTSDRDRGDTKLLEICQSLSLEPRNRPVICVFDRDNEKLLKQLADADPENKGYQDWGNNVYSMAIPIPKHRADDSPISIEMYYSDEVLKRITPEGRRLCFDNEIKKEVVQNKVMRSVLLPASVGSESARRIVSTDVHTIEDDHGRKIGLSKAQFAEMIRTKTAPYADVDFSAFRSIIEQIDQIVVSGRCERESVLST